MLAVLKAGAAYVRLQPNLPGERLARIIAASGLAIILAENRTAENLPAASARVVLLEQELAGEGDDSSPPSAAVHPDPESTACIYYKTSPDGESQGVEISHRALWNCLASLRSAPGLSAGDVVLWHGSTPLGLELFELWLPLSVGARTVIAPEATVLDGPGFYNFMEAHGITVMRATPSAWRLLVQSGWRGGQGLKAISSGEALLPGLAGTLAACCKEVWNVYGTAESASIATVGRVAAGARRWPPSGVRRSRPRWRLRVVAALQLRPWR